MRQLILSGRICGWFAAVTSATRGASLFRLPEQLIACTWKFVMRSCIVLSEVIGSQYVNVLFLLFRFRYFWIYLYSCCLQDCPTHGRSWKCGIVLACRSLEQEATFCTAFLTPSLRHWPKMVWKRIVSLHRCCDVDFWKGVCHFQPKIPIPKVQSWGTRFGPVEQVAWFCTWLPTKMHLISGDWRLPFLFFLVWAVTSLGSGAAHT